MRNNRKSGIDKADQAVGRSASTTRGASRPLRPRRIPAQRAVGRRGGRGRGFRLVEKVLPMPIKMKMGRGKSMWIL